MRQLEERHPVSGRQAWIDDSNGVTILYLSQPNRYEIECRAWVSQEPAPERGKKQSWLARQFAGNGSSFRVPEEHVAVEGRRKSPKLRDLRIVWTADGDSVALAENGACLAFCEEGEPLGWSRDLIDNSTEGQPLEIQRFLKLFKGENPYIQSERFPEFELELSDRMVNLICDCCGEPVQRVWGYVSKNNEAYAVYFGLLVKHDDDRWVGLTVSVGKWWDDSSVDERQWCHMQAWNDGENFALSVREPNESNFYPWERGGKAMPKDVVLASDIKDEFFAVADFVNIEDPAINTFLLEEPVSIRGRGCKHDDHIDYGGQEMLETS